MTKVARVSAYASKRRDNVQRQANEHPLIEVESFTSVETYVLHLIHLRAYEEAAAFVEGRSVLDVGCNLGYGLKVLATTALSVAGIDVSPHAVDVAQDRLGSIADIRVYDGILSSFPAASFDVVTSFQVIEHISNYAAYLSEIARVLRPGGTVLFTTPNALLRLDPGVKPMNPFHVREFSPKELKDVLAAWYESVEIRGLFAIHDLYEIERERCERGKIAARSWLARVRVASTRVLNRDFPWLASIRDSLRPRANRAAQQMTITDSEMKRFSTQDLFYRADRVDDALDFMAVCRKPR